MGRLHKAAWLVVEGGRVHTALVHTQGELGCCLQWWLACFLVKLAACYLVEELVFKVGERNPT